MSGKRLNMVFGFQLSVAFMMTMANFSLMQPIAEFIPTPTEHEAMGWSFLISSLSCLMSLLISIILAWMDKTRTRRLPSTERRRQKKQVVRLSDLTKFPISFWLLCIACLTYYGTIYSYIMMIWPPDSISEMVGASCLWLHAPLLGFLVDRLGKNITWIFLAVLTTAAVILYEMDMAIIFPSALAVAFCLFTSAILPIAALQIPEKQLTTAYGLIQAILNLSTADITMATGDIVKTKTTVFLLSIVIVIICIWVWDFFTAGNLNMSPGEREVRSVIKRLMR